MSDVLQHDDEGALPGALADRVRRALERHAPAPSAELPAADEAMRRLAAGEGLLAEVLAGDERSRETALDLLAADALVTEAFERLAANPETLDDRAADAVRRIASLALVGQPPRQGPTGTAG